MKIMNEDVPTLLTVQYELQALKIENGKNLAYIAELEDINKKLSTNCVEYLKDEHIKKLNQIIKEKDLEIHKLRIFRDKLLNKLALHGIQ